MDRRDFNRRATRLCGALLAAGTAIPSKVSLAESAPMPRSRLVGADGRPLDEDDLLTGEAWIFSYPYRTTPCFLVRLPEPGADGESIVAFSAICSHKMTHPSRPISHIAYREQPVAFVDRDGEQVERAHLISCCSERSVYDPGAGGAVLAGPAPAPLARIALARDTADGARGLAAIGSTGPDRYAPFLEKFGFRLAMEYGVTDVRQRAGATTLAERAEVFSRQTIRC